jgi:hypothetical protein
MRIDVIHCAHSILINCASNIMAASIAQTCLNRLRTHYHDHIDCTNMLASIAQALSWRHQLRKHYQCKHYHGGINCASIIMAASIAQTWRHQLPKHYHGGIDCTNMAASIAHGSSHPHQLFARVYPHDLG